MALAVTAPIARPYAGRLAVSGALVLVQVAVVLVRPWPLALTVDHALTSSGGPLSVPVVGPLAPRTVLVLAAVTTVALSLLLGALDLVLEQLSEGTAERIGADLRTRLFDHTLTRSLRWHDRIRSGELLSRLTSDVGRLLDAVVATTTSLVPDAVMLVGVMVLVLSIDPTLALVGLSVVPVLAVLSTWQRRRVRAAQRAAREESGRLAAVTTDLLRNVRAIQSFGRTDRATAAFSARNRLLLQAELGAVGVQARWTPVPDIVLAVGTALVLGVGGSHVLAGSLSIGGLLVVLAYLRDLYAPVRGLTRLSAVLAKAGASGARVQEVLDCEEAVRDWPGAVTAPALVAGVRFEGVRFDYEPGRPVVEQLDLDVRAGEVLCVVGPSGAGKSTLLSLLLRLYDVDAGRVLVDGTDVRDCDLASLRSRFAYMPQDPWMLDASVAENIALGNPRATRSEIEAAGRAALVDEFVDGLPDGYDTVLGEGAARLSGGQRRRVALARAAVSTAPMLLLDEPTTSLDAASAEGVLRALRTTTAGRTALVVTHDPRVERIADRVVVLTRDGAPVDPAYLSVHESVGR
jgi:ABC-type multidrug transport system fused ATPase/permease subunit